MTHEEAIEIVKTQYPHDHVMKTALGLLIPELRESESEDERIRSEIIDYLGLVGKGDGDYAQPMIDRWIAWLGKQGCDVKGLKGPQEIGDWRGDEGVCKKQKESLHISEMCKENADSFTSEDERIRKEIIDIVEAYRANCVYEGTHRFDDCLAYLEKQKYDRMKPIYDAKESFESALEKAWNDYHNGYENVDKLEDDYVECAHAKGFREGYLFGIEKQKEQKPNYCHYGGDPSVERCKYCSASCSGRLVEERYSPLCNTIKDKIHEYIANHFIADTVVKTDMRSIVKAMEEGVRLGKEERKPAEWSEEDEKIYQTVFNHFNSYITFTCSNGVKKEHILSWLKSLRPSRKPSEEQIRSFEYFIKLWGDSNGQLKYTKVFNDVKSLCEQLKKL